MVARSGLFMPMKSISSASVLSSIGKVVASRVIGLAVEEEEDASSGVEGRSGVVSEKLL